MSTSHETPRRHDRASQSERPFSTSSTKSNRSSGKYLRNTSRSSAELTVMVQTVLLPAASAETPKRVNSPIRTTSCLYAPIEKDHDKGNPPGSIPDGRTRLRRPRPRARHRRRPDRPRLRGAHPDPARDHPPADP